MHADSPTPYIRAAIGVSFIIGFLALVDWCADGGTLEYLMNMWSALPNILQLVIVCLSVGVVIMFGFWAFLIRTAEPVDENECPIQVKGKR